MQTKLEKENQKAVMKALKGLDAYTVKTVITSRNGVSDIIACLPKKITQEMVGQTLGLYVAIEMKREGLNARPLQDHKLKKVRDAGGIAGVARDVEELKSLLS